MTSIRSVIVWVAFAAITVAALPRTADASHFRGAHLSWTRLGSTVTFHSIQEFDADEVTPLPIIPGDGDTSIIGPVSILFTGTDLAGDTYRIVEYTVSHTYATAGPFTAFLGLDNTPPTPTNCCRLFSLSLINASNQPYRIETVVDLRAAGNTGAPTGSLPPFASVPRIMQLPAGAPNASVFFPVTDPNGDPFTCGPATAVQSGIPAVPVLAITLTTVPGGCELAWDTTGLVPTTKYAVQVQLDENNPSFPGVRSALDFLLEITAPECGDDALQTGVGEECDGADSAACPGACRPPGGPHECECPRCGDVIIDAPGEECDGTAGGVFGPCPGLCLTSVANACQCAVCGDNETTVAAGEQCDGTSDAVCPGRCLNDCSCAVCGDNVTEGPEQCDGTSDAACPGRCLGDCSCAVCGDNVTEGPEQCDGTSDLACPGACQPTCTCGTCGDNLVNVPGEQCDGTADAACPGRCLGDCSCAVCGDNVTEGPEQCDGSSDAACPGRCLASCTCEICGNGAIEGAEQCDGANAAACPGLCRAPGDLNECRCPVCGDGDVNQPGETCDGSDDATCPGNCTTGCTCAVCGDNLPEAPAETCDGTADAACPGQCRPPGGPNECHCPICGDGEINVTGEVCDGADAAACPGLCLPASDPNACRCPICGDGAVNQPSEECDGPATGMCTEGLCQPDCTYATCGNCNLDTGEQCDPPNGEICDNLIDDDGDGRLNCADPDCTPGRTCIHPSNPIANALISSLACASSGDCNFRCSHDLTTPCTTNAACNALSPGSFCINGARCLCPDLPTSGFQTCGGTCQTVSGCGCILNDPARIRFGNTAAQPGLLKIHGRFVFAGDMDPTADGFTFLLSNDGGIVYQASLLPGDLVGSKGRYKFIDPLAKSGLGTRGGLGRVTIKLKIVKGALNYVFHVQAYGDFTAASSFMTTQVIAGNDTASLSGTWTAIAKGWKLTSFE